MHLVCQSMQKRQRCGRACFDVLQWLGTPEGRSRTGFYAQRRKKLLLIDHVVAVRREADSQDGAEAHTRPLAECGSRQVSRSLSPGRLTSGALRSLMRVPSGLKMS
ncbi:hypothetical protein QQF64_035364 [Cirrhinus molitorella]|uniref:Uncharacterized protein n=1 Tax=Cirrhinus molitorella TaxID=172907 RepID=A0ABR3NFK5_9TELE